MAKRRLAFALGQISVTLAVLGGALWWLGPGMSAEMELLLVAVGLALVLTDLAALFAYTAAVIDRPDSRAYLADLEGDPGEGDGDGRRNPGDGC